MNKIIISESQLNMILNKLNDKSLLKEEHYDDLMEFLGQGFGKMTQGTAYYVSNINSSMNKNIVNPETGEKEPNPMYGKLYKHTRFMFKWGDTYQRARERKGTVGEPGSRSGEFEKLEGFDMLETGKSGLYLPIIPTGSEYVYAIKENDTFVEIDKEEARKYLKPMGPQSSDRPPFRLLITDNIFKLTGGGNVWTNSDFRYNYIGPGQ